MRNAEGATMARDITRVNEGTVSTTMGSGSPFGVHRVVEPKGVLPQPARRLDNDMDRFWDNEIMVDVDILNVDSASFTQIKGEAGGDPEKVKETILGIVTERGKMQNPVTGSGGMFTGRVAKVGSALASRDLDPGDRIASLVSLSLTPLRIGEVLDVHMDTDQVEMRGRAILFESGIYAKMPDDMPDKLALAVLDVCGAPLQTERLVKPGDTVAILGATGKSGVLCAYVARRVLGSGGTLIGLGHSPKNCERLEALGICDAVARVDSSDALACYGELSRLTGGRLADVVINCVNIQDAEMACILMCRDGGTVYFFSMATSFTKAALGAEGVGRDVTMIIGNGYMRGHAEHALSILRESKEIRELYESLYT
jgi:L-erythro-3,5-diaminohexanoate dehydrogenase